MNAIKFHPIKFHATIHSNHLRRDQRNRRPIFTRPRCTRSKTMAPWLYNQNRLTRFSFLYTINVCCSFKTL